MMGANARQPVLIDSVPVIDIADLGSPGALQAIDTACQEWGFFQVTGHGIAVAEIAELFGVARAFFAQPGEAKRRILRTASNPWGFFDQELTKNTRDWKEIYDYGPAQGDLLKPQWPDGLPSFETAVRGYYRDCEQLAFRVLDAIAKNLGMPGPYLARHFDGPHSSFLRLNYYPRCPAETAGVIDTAPLGVGQHTDAGALTLLLQDHQPGLQVFREGDWYLVEPRPGALVVNIGDIIQVWSNDRYRAGLHRVVTHPSRDRFSVPFFFNPAYSTNYEPLPTTVSVSSPPRYRSINWGEFRASRATGDYADYGEEVQITHYRT
jgi:isopenicillin N synthase-like dioxygenase